MHFLTGFLYNNPDMHWEEDFGLYWVDANADRVPLFDWYVSCIDNWARWSDERFEPNGFVSMGDIVHNEWWDLLEQCFAFAVDGEVYEAEAATDFINNVLKPNLDYYKDYYLYWLDCHI